jgi:hypothetical protein
MPGPAEVITDLDGDRVAGREVGELLDAQSVVRGHAVHATPAVDARGKSVRVTHPSDPLPPNMHCGACNPLTLDAGGVRHSAHQGDASPQARALKVTV